jgi:hypothetical protein
MMTWATIGLLAGLIASADEGTFVVVDRDSWLYAEPDVSSRRIRVVEVEQAPDHELVPVVVLEQLGERAGFVKVRTVTMPPKVQGDGLLGSPTAVPTDWPHCYAPPTGIAQIELESWVEKTDLMSVVTQSVSVERPEGGVVTLMPGLALYGGREGRYRASAEHIDVTISLPEDAVGTSYQDVRRGRFPAVTFVAGEGVNRYQIAPSWDARIAALHETVRLVSGPLDGERTQTVQRIDDRCVSLQMAQPVRGIPERAPRSTEQRYRFPVRVPVDTKVVWSDGVILGKIRGGDAILWDRRSCKTHPEHGICCDPPAGIRFEDDSSKDLTLCFEADMPEIITRRSLRDVFSDMQEEMVDRVANPEAYQRTVGDVTWQTPQVMGSISASDVQGVLLSQIKGMEFCYSRALRRVKSLGGELELRFALGRDGFPRGMRVSQNGLGDDALGECLVSTLERVMIPNQVGMEPSTVHISLLFLPPGE